MGLYKRISVIYILLLATFSFLLLRLFLLTDNKQAESVLSGQYSRRIDICEKSGFIYDKNMQCLNHEKTGYICLIFPSAVKNARACAASISKISTCKESEIVEKLAVQKPFLMEVSEYYTEGGIYCFEKYKEATVCAEHIIGYKNIDGLGMSGIEKQLSPFLSSSLSGKVSFRYFASANGLPLENSGSALSDIGYSEKSGVVTTLDKDLQLFCEKVADEHLSAGAVCISEISSGAICSSVSTPGFDTGNIVSYLDSDKGELINRCAVGFTPGSIFKTVVAGTALEENPELYNLEYSCTGKYITESGKEISCHNKKGHGKIAMKEAYAESCNCYFINISGKLGAEKILSTATKMGLGTEKSIFGIGSYSGLVPECIADDIFLANLAIGQGELLICPYEALNIFSCASTGYYCEPYVVSSIFKGENTIKNYSSKPIKVLKEETVTLLREMMSYCVSDGLGKEATPENLIAGGKTATAQTGQYKNGKEILNSWFCGVYPIQAPKYAICVLADGNGENGNPKAVFRKLCDYLWEYREKYGINAIENLQ